MAKLGRRPSEENHIERAMEARDQRYIVSATAVFSTVVPSPANLVLLRKKEDPTCSLCGRLTNLEHILSSSQRALTDGSYHWRHDKALSEMEQHLKKAVKKS